MVSVVIPAYNAEEYISQAVRSVLGQTYTDVEAVVVNDGSTDAAGDVCRNLQAEDGRVRYFEKGNTGVSDTRNFGMEKARGEYVFFLDADDYIPDYALEALVCEMEKRKAGAVFGIHAYDYDGKILPRVPRVTGGGYTYKELAARLLDDGTLSGMLFGSVGGIVQEGSYRRRRHIIRPDGEGQ